jgi:AcrR family transcriptional regulator
METAEKITGKAQDLFTRHGIRNTSMDEIAIEAGISKKTVYQFYPHKDALIEAWISRELDTHVKTCKMLLSQNTEAIMELFFIFYYTRELYRKLHPALILDLATHYPDVFAKIEEHKNEFLLQTIKNNMARGTQADLYMDDFNADNIARFMVESITMLSNHQHFSSKAGIENKCAEEVFGYLINGIVSQSGREIIKRYKNQRGIISLLKEPDQPFWDH